jgi:hypothetical protein
MMKMLFMGNPGGKRKTRKRLLDDADRDNRYMVVRRRRLKSSVG